MEIKTLRGLRKAVEKEYGRPLSNQRWWMLKPDYRPPFNEYEVYDILGGVPDYKPRKPMRRKNVKKALRTFIEKTSKESYEALKHRAMMRDYRKNVIGLPNPVPIEELETRVREFFKRVKKRSFYDPLPYPKKIYQLDIGNRCLVNVFEIGWLSIPREWDNKTGLSGAVSINSYYFGFHPALITAFILCDLVPKIYSLPTIIIDGQDVNLVINNLKVPSWMVSKAYSAIKQKMVKEQRPVNGEIARPRFQTRRVITLIRFIRKSLDDNPSIDWKGLFNKWNEKYPKWAYSSLHSMQVIWYRVRETYYNKLHTEEILETIKDDYEMTEKLKEIKNGKNLETSSGRHP